ncbi:MAG: cysteine desulfurase [Bacteroidia bacterium]|nr:cysteine desulfurase [Bacteroidia bacterium]
MDVEKIRADFPILSQKVHGKDLAFLDNAASSQKPQQVLDATNNYYKTQHANIHRGVYHLSQVATFAYENSRKKIQKFINAASEKEIIFVRGTTEGINLVASSYGKDNVKAGDEIIITHMEHHSNIVPWQMLCKEKDAKLQVVPINDDGEMIFEELEKLISEKTKLIALAHISNSLGTINPVKDVIELAHQHNIPVLLDGAQAVPHEKVDVQELDCDFYTFSSHKVYGPTGIGVLYGKEELLEKMGPYQGGGDMIKSVTFEKTTYNDLPHKFEAGTPDIAGVVGLAVAIDYVESIGYDNIFQHEQELLKCGTEALSQIDGLKIIGTAKNKASVISFDMDGIHPHDIGQFLDNDGIAVRTGHHCTQPVMDRFNVPATTRASFSFYNTKEEIDRLVAGLIKVKEVFS